MPTIERSVVLNAAAGEVHNLLASVERAKEIWGSENMTTEGNWPDVGSTAVITNKMGPISAKINATALAYEHGKHFIQKMEGTINGTMRIDLAAEGDATRFTIVMDYEAPGGILSGAIDKLVVSRQVADTLEHTINALKKATAS